MRGSHPRPRACHARALLAELMDQTTGRSTGGCIHPFGVGNQPAALVIEDSPGVSRWSWLELHQPPLAYQTSALTYMSYKTLL